MTYDATGLELRPGARVAVSAATLDETGTVEAPATWMLVPEGWSVIRLDTGALVTLPPDVIYRLAVRAPRQEDAAA